MGEQSTRKLEQELANMLYEHFGVPVDNVRYLNIDSYTEKINELTRVARGANDVKITTHISINEKGYVIGDHKNEIDISYKS